MATTCSAKTVRDQTNALKGHTVVIVGGSCGMGKGSAIHVLQKGAAVILVSRSAEKLDKAKKECEAAVPSGQVSVRAVDCSDETAVQKLFASFTPGSINHLIVTGGPSAGCGAFEADTLAKVKKQFDVKYFMSWMCAHEAAPKLADGGSITFFSGALSRRPGKGSSALGSVNAALECLTKALAHDLGPRLRVNCVSPGLARTEAFSGMPQEAQNKMFEGFGKGIPSGRAGEIDDLGHAAAFLVSNNWMTGAVLDCDGGAIIR